MADEPHVEMIRNKLTEKFGSLWQAAYRLSFGTMSGAELLTALRGAPEIPMHQGYAKSIEDAVGVNPNSLVNQAQPGE